MTKCHLVINPKNENILSRIIINIVKLKIKYLMNLNKLTKVKAYYYSNLYLFIYD